MSNRGLWTAPVSRRVQGLFGVETSNPKAFSAIPVILARDTIVISSISADGSSLPEWVTDNAGTLHFARVTRDDAGNYTCIASNEPQGQIRAHVQLTVAGATAADPRELALTGPGGNNLPSDSSVAHYFPILPGLFLCSFHHLQSGT